MFARTGVDLIPVRFSKLKGPIFEIIHPQIPNSIRSDFLCWIFFCPLRLDMFDNFYHLRFYFLSFAMPMMTTLCTTDGVAAEAMKARNMSEIYDQEDKTLAARVALLEA